MTKENTSVKKVPNLRFKEFSEDWETRKLGEIATNKSKKYNPKNNNTSIKCIELEHLESETGQLLGFIDGSQSGSIKNVFQKGNVLFGKLRPYLKKYHQPNFDGVCSSEIWVLNGKEISNNFLYYLIQTNSFIDLANQSSGSKMPRADWSILENGLFSFPSLNEQQKISSFISLLDSRIDCSIKTITHLETLIKGVCQKLAKNKQWKKQHLRDILTERKEPNKNNLPVFSVSVSKGVINQIEYLGRSFAAKNTDNYNVVHFGDIVYTKSPTGEFPYGIIKQSFIKENVAVSPLYGVYIPKDIHIGSILHYYFNNPINANNYLHSLIQKGAKNTINITNQRFLDNKIFLPTDEKEIGKIASLLNFINQKIETEKAILKQLENQKRYLLQNMFV